MIDEGQSDFGKTSKTIHIDQMTVMELIWIPGGTFMMGDTFGDSGENSNELPVHQVRLDGYWIGKYPVTEEQWKAVMGVSIFDKLLNVFMNAFHQAGKKSGDPNAPATYVSWFKAQAFIEKVNERSAEKLRLPTEAEWEYAAREGGRKVRFGTGKETIGPDEANFNARSREPYSRTGEFREKTVPVGSFAPNALGLYDMAGNVWEWVNDGYERNYYKNSPERNPQAPGSGVDRVLRGGSWIDRPSNLRASYRKWQVAKVGNNLSGFRCAQ